MMRKLRIGVLGPLVGAKNGAITQGEVLAELWRHEGYEVVAASSEPNRIRRMAEILTTVYAQRHALDVVCLQVYSGRSFVVEDAASALACRFDRCLVMHLHGGGLPDFMTRFPAWTGRVLARAEAVVTPSAFLQRAVARYGLKATVIPNVIDLPAYPFRARHEVEPRLFWMRAFHHVYNPEMAVLALAEIRRTFPNATLVMAGPDMGRLKTVQRLAATMKLGAAVRFTGTLDLQGKVREARDADIYLNTNRVDNTPVSVVEACSMGMPVVSTNVGGVPDLLNGEQDGLLVPSDDPNAMANAVIRLCRTPELAARLSIGGRQLAQRFSWPAVKPRWQELFAAVADPRLVNPRQRAS